MLANHLMEHGVLGVSRAITGTTQAMPRVSKSVPPCPCLNIDTLALRPHQTTARHTLRTAPPSSASSVSR